MHPTKSIFIPTQSFEYIGFVLISKVMTISVTDSKKEKIKFLCKEIFFGEKCSFRRAVNYLASLRVASHQ